MPSASGRIVPAACRPRWLRLPRSRRGIFALLLLTGGVGALMRLGSVQVSGWTETADFCGRCHTMGPELVAYDVGPHSEVPCAECHVEPGVAGWIKAKINGTKQLLEIVTGLFPKPIPPPDHATLPPTKDTCLRCHSPEQLRRPSTW